MKWLKITLYTFLALFVASLIFVGFAPFLLSSKMGNEWLTKQVNQRITGEVVAEQIHLSWFGPQTVNGFALKDEKSKEIARFQAFETDTNLFSLIFHPRRLGQTLLKAPYLYLVKEEEGELNIEKTLKKKSSKPKSDHTKKPTQWPLFTAAVNISDGEILFASPRVKQVSINNMQLDYQPDKALFHLRAETKQGEITGEILASGTICPQTHILAQINNFPVAIFDQLRDESFYTTAIGETIDCKIETTKHEENYYLSANLSSTNVNGVIEGEIVDQEFILSPQSALTYTFTPTTFYEMIGVEQRKTWQLANKTDLKITVQEGIFPIDCKKLCFTYSRLHAQAHLERAEVNHKEAGPYSLNDFEAMIIAKDKVIDICATGHVQGKEDSKITLSAQLGDNEGICFGLTTEGFPFTLLELVFDEADAVHTFFGETVNMQVTGTCNKGKTDAHFEINSSITKMAGDIEGSTLKDLSFHVTGERMLQENWRTVFGPSLSFAMNGKAAVIERNFSLSTIKGKLQNPYLDVDVRGRLGKKGQPFSYDQVELTANGTLLQLPYKETFPDTTLKKGNFVISVDGSKNTIVGTGKIIVSVITAEGDKVESKASEIKVIANNFVRDNRLDLKNADVDFKANLQHFPVAIVEPFLPEGMTLSVLTGPIINAKTQGSYTPGEPDGYLAQIELKADAEGFATHFSVGIDGTLTINQPEPAYLRWEMTPERYRELIAFFWPDKQGDFSLSSASSIELTMTELKCPKLLPEDISSFFCQSGIVGSLKIGPMIFMSKTTPEILTVKNVEGSIKGENFSEAIALDIHGDLFASNVPSSEKSAFTFKGDLLHLWTPGGKVDRDQLMVSGELNLELLPVRQLTGIIPMKDETRTVTRALLGELLNARVSGEVSQMQGPVTVDIKASNLKALLPIQLTPKAILLRDYVDAEITLTDEISETLLVDVNPLLITGATSDHPLKLYIDPQGFSVPIDPFVFKEMNVEKAILDIGKIRVRNGGEIQALMDFLKAQDISEDKWMDAWFTPIFISLNDGNASYKRFDLLLASSVHLAFWGKIDLVKDKVRMTMGIAPTTLQQRFNIRGLSRKEMFQVKMRGKTSDVELDWSSASTRIGIIAAKSAGGSIGFIVGGVLEQILDAFGEEPTPHPRPHPYLGNLNTPPSLAITFHKKHRPLPKEKESGSDVVE